MFEDNNVETSEDGAKSGIARQGYNVDAATLVN